MTEPQQEAAEQDSEFSFDGDFDAERAKSLLARLKDENRSLKQNRTPQDERDNKVIAALKKQLAEAEPKAKQFQALEDASKSEAQRLSEAAEQAKREAETARADAHRWQAAATHGIPAEHFDLLGTGTPEEITARAEKLSALLTAQATAAAPVTPAGAPTTRPVEQMRPGASPAGAVSEDEALYQSLFGPAQ